MTVDGSHQDTEAIVPLHLDRRDGGERLGVVVWRFPGPLLTVSSAPLGGGLGPRHWVVNAQVPPAYARTDPDVHLGEIASAAALDGPGVGMLTAVDLDDLCRAEDAGVRADVSVGLTVPTWAAAPDGEGHPGGGPGEAHDSRRAGRAAGAPAGTVNVVCLVPERLSAAALVNAVATATEAKAQALWDAGVAGTGTASDAVCIACPLEGPEHAFGGPRSVWGARVARAVHAAVLAGARAGARAGRTGARADRGGGR